MAIDTMTRRYGLLAMIAVFSLSGCARPHDGGTVLTLHYQCGTLPLTVYQDNRLAQVSFILDGKQLHLPQAAAASGIRYDDGHYVFWSKGHQAFIEREGRIIINDCVLNGESGK